MDEVIDVYWSDEGVYYEPHHIANVGMFTITVLYHFGSLIITAFTGVL